MIISIDIGTCYSSVCLINNQGKAETVETSTGMSMYGSKYSLPSAVFVNDDGTVYVGQAAMNSRKRRPQNFKAEFKRNLGQNVPVLIGGRSFMPEDFYKEMFMHMKSCAEKRGNGTVEKTYITYPASYGKAKCDKIVSAAKNVGLFDVELIDEPTAAAMCYGAKGSLKDNDILLVYDFGGGTFDVSLIKYEKGQYVPLTNAMGIEHCGGIDFDRAIYSDMLSKIDPEVIEQISAVQKNKLRFGSLISELAVKIKHQLSSTELAVETIPIGFDVVDYTLSREQLDSMTAGLVSQTIDCCRSILEVAGLTIDEIDRILLVGGTTRVPLVQEMVRKFAGDTPVLADIDPELAVAQGALELHRHKLTPNKDRATEIASEPDEPVHEHEPKSGAAPASRPASGRAAAVSEPTLGPEPAAMSGTKPGYGHAPKHRAFFVPGAISASRSESHQASAAHEAKSAVKGYKPFSLSDFFYEECLKLPNWARVVNMRPGCRELVKRYLMDPKSMAEISCKCETLFKKNGNIHTSDPEYIRLRNAPNLAFLPRIVYGRILCLHKDGHFRTYLSNVKMAECMLKYDYGQYNVDNWRDIVSFSSGYYHTVGLRKDGRVVAVGNNDYGQCSVEGWNNISSVYCNGNYTVGLRNDGRVVAVGDNKYGQCNVEGWNNIAAVYVYDNRTVGLKNNGQVVAVGDNEYGQCNVAGWNDIVSVGYGHGFLVGLRRDGRVVAAGNNKDGRCSVEGWKDIAAVSCNTFNTIGLKTDGQVVVTGDNTYGECYLNGFNDVIAIGSGFRTSYGVTSDGKLVRTNYREVSEQKMFSNKEKIFPFIEISDWSIFD